MAEQDLALTAAGGHDENAFEGWGAKAVGKADTKKWNTGEEILSLLKTATAKGQNCIRKLFIFSHAWSYRKDGNRGGVWAHGGPGDSGLYAKKQKDDNAGARDLDDLKAAIKQGEIKFCEQCYITLTGCRVAASNPNFAAELAKITGCTVTAAMAGSSPEITKRLTKHTKKPRKHETGKWISAAGDDEEKKAAKDSGKDLGWREYDKDGKEKELGKTITVWK